MRRITVLPVKPLSVVDLRLLPMVTDRPDTRHFASHENVTGRPHTQARAAPNTEDPEHRGAAWFWGRIGNA